MKTFRAISVVLVLAVTMTFSVDVAAQDERDRAQQLYKEGAEAYYTDDFPLAIMKFKSGHALDPNPMFLYNIAVSYGRLGNIDEAYDHAIEAREDGLPPEAADKNSARIESWQIALRSSEIAESIAGPGEAQARACTTDSDCGGGMVCDTSQSACVGSSADLTAGTTSESTLGTLGWTGIGLGIVGIGLVTTALVLDSSLSSDFDELDQARADGDQQRAEQLEADIESTQSTGQIMLFAGAGAAVVGGTLLVIDLLDSDEKESAQIVPMLGREQVGASFMTRF